MNELTRREHTPNAIHEPWCRYLDALDYRPVGRLKLQLLDAFVRGIQCGYKIRKEECPWISISEIPSNLKDGRELPLFREDAGWFMGFYGTCEHLGLSQDEIEAIDEESFFAQTWWAFSQDGAGRIEGTEEPTHFMPPLTPPTQKDS